MAHALSRTGAGGRVAAQLCGGACAADDRDHIEVDKLSIFRRKAQIPGGDDARLRELYRHALDRAPDEAGARHYGERLRQGAGFEDLLRELVDSREAQGRNHRSSLQRYLREKVWAGRRDPDVPQLVFLHVMKTGGTTLNDALRDSIGRQQHIATDLLLDDLLCMPAYAVSNAWLLTGHLPFETLELLDSPVVTFTLLRDPVERVISHWWHVRQHAPADSEVKQLELGAFIERAPWSTLANNYQARHMAHRIGVTGAWRDWSPIDRYVALGDSFQRGTEYPLQSLFDSSPLANDPELETAALESLARIDVVGVTEHSERVYEQLAQRVDYLPSIETPERRNRGERRPQQAAIDESLIARIRELNRVDQRLYEEALKRSESD